MGENFPKLKKETYPDTGETEGSQQDETKQTYTRTYYNKNGKIIGKEKILKAGKEKQLITREPI